MDGVALGFISRLSAPMTALDIVERIEAGGQLAEEAGAPPERRDQLGENGGGPADPFEVTGAGATRHDAADEAFDVADPGQQAAEPVGKGGVGDEHGGGVEAFVDRPLLHQRRGEPVSQQTGPHRRTGAVEDPGQGAAPPVAGGAAGADELQAAPRGLVDLHPLAASPGGERRDPRDRRRLVLVEVMNDPAGRADAGEITGEVEAEPFETRSADGPIDRAAGASLLKPPIGARGDGA